MTAHRHRDPSMQHLHPGLASSSANEVLASREAILAEDVARDRYLRNRESLADLGATSLICAPVMFGDKVLGLIHLYCTDPHKAAGRRGPGVHRRRRQAARHGHAPAAAAGVADGREPARCATSSSVESELVGDQPGDQGRSRSRSAAWPAPTPRC